jgi:hypothetical protein
MQVLFDLGWHRLHTAIIEGSVVDNGINERALCQLDGAIAEAFDCYTNIVGWMALVFDVEVKILEIGDGVGDLLFRWSEEDAIVDVDNEYDVVLIKYTIINQGLGKVDLPQFLNEVLVPHAAHFFLSI